MFLRLVVILFVLLVLVLGVACALAVLVLILMNYGSDWCICEIIVGEPRRTYESMTCIYRTC